MRVWRKSGMPLKIGELARWRRTWMMPPSSVRLRCLRALSSRRLYSTDFWTCFLRTSNFQSRVRKAMSSETIIRPKAGILRPTVSSSRPSLIHSSLEMSLTLATSPPSTMVRIMFRYLSSLSVKASGTTLT